MPQPNHLFVVADGVAPPLTRDASLIAEFCVQADVAATTMHKYRTQLGEFSLWLTHPMTRRADRYQEGRRRAIHGVPGGR